jgi:hypothetical protein
MPDGKGQADATGRPTRRPGTRGTPTARSTKGGRRQATPDGHTVAGSVSRNLRYLSDLATSWTSTRRRCWPTIAPRASRRRRSRSLRHRCKAPLLATIRVAARGSCSLGCVVAKVPCNGTCICVSSRLCLRPPPPGAPVGPSFWVSFRRGWVLAVSGPRGRCGAR